MKKILAILLVILFFAGCAVVVNEFATTAPTKAAQIHTDPKTEAAEKLDPIVQFMNTMTLEEKVAQLFIIHPQNIGVTTSATQMTPELLAQYPVGGFILAMQNILNERQITDLCAAMKMGRIPAFVSTDEEGGLVSRFANHSAFDLPKYKSAGAVGASGNREDALEMGNTIGQYLSRYGVNMDFAPVADVNTNPRNPIIGTRAFSSDPVIAAKMAQAMAQGLQQNHVIPVYKHFPGHGDTAEDSHSKLAISYKTLEQLQTCEWLPYQSLGTDVCVMIAHVALPKVTGNMTPATMSAKIVQDYLRQELGFSGVVITDGMEMGAISNTYSSGEAAVSVIQAGCDMILLPENFKQAYTAILSAVEDGTLTEKRIDESIYRILQLKNTYGLFDVATAKKLADAGLAVEGRVVNGVNTKDGIILNLESAKYLNSTVGHEITHALEGTEHYDVLKNAIKEYAELKGEYKNKYSSLESIYAKKDANGNILKDENGKIVWIRDDVDIDSEVVADLVGDYLFTDEDFINNLSAKHRNVFQKIYDEIKYLCKIATAGSDEARKLEEVKMAFDKAYKANKASTDADVKYSLGETTDGRFVAVVDNDILSKIDLSKWDKETKKAVKKAANEELKKFSSGFVINGVEYVGNKDSRDEYIRSDYSEALARKNTTAYLDKMRATSVLDDVVRVATGWANDGELKYDREDYVDFVRGKALIMSGGRGYKAVVLAGITEEGKAIFHDVEDVYPDSFEMKKSESSTAVLTSESSNAILEDSDEHKIAQVPKNVNGKFSISADSEGDVEQLVVDDVDNIIWDIERNVDIDSTNGISEVLYNSDRETIVNKLTGEEISENTYAVLSKLERGEDVPISELEALKEVQEGKLKAVDFRDDFIAQHPELKVFPAEDVGTHLIDTPEREQLRNDILQKRLSQGSFTGIDKNGDEVYNGSVEKGKRLDIIIGLPASGKSSAIVNPLSEFYKSVVIDSDIIKKELPEYNDGWGASLVHEESSKINLTLFDEATQLGNNIVLPIVGAKTSSVEKYMATAKERGYEVHLHLNELPGSKAMGRMLGRYFNTGRFIDPAIAAKYGNKPTEVYETMKGRGDISGYSRWDNDVAIDQRPTHTEISRSLEVYGAYSDSWRAVRGTDVGRNDSESQTETYADVGDGVEGLRRRLETDAPRRKYSIGSTEISEVVRLTPKTEEALLKSGVVSFELIDSSNDSNAFSVALDAARKSDVDNGWAVTPKTAEGLVKYNIRAIMSADRKAGLGVAPDGDIEAVFKNKNGGPAKALDTLIPAALEAGGNKLDCYGTGLVRVYSQYGFVPVARVTFVSEFANEGWTPDKGTPDKVYRHRY